MKHFFSLFLLVLGLSTSAQTVMNIYQSNGTVLQIPLNSIDSITFTVNNPGNLATLNTLPIVNISSSSAESGGNITNGGGTPVTQRGICWSSSPNPTTANNNSNNGSGEGSYASTFFGLLPGVTYYVRAYAINSAGTAYGNELSFTTTGGAGTITALNCGAASNSGTLTAGTAASGVISIVPYTGGNGGTHIGQSVFSSGITGLTATLGAGSFVIGSSSLTYTITGTPSAAGTAIFLLSIGGQVCALSRTVEIGIPLYTPGPGVTDQNGNTYATIIMNNGQEWMAENLRTTTYANGDPIPNVTDVNLWGGLTSGAWAHYNNNTQNEDPYGKLYNWTAVADPRNVCPTNWHVPADEEWTILTDFLGGENVAGGKMKTTTLWLAPNTGATNESGFSGLPGGGLYVAGSFFFQFVEYGWWWSASEGAVDAAWSRNLSYNNPNIGRSERNNRNGYSVRCVRD